MGKRTFSMDSYSETRAARGITSDAHVTRKAEQEAKHTGKLDPSVDPSVDVIRRSLLRFNRHGDQWVVTIGCPMDVESICDTTGSMGGNVDIAMKVLPDTYRLCSQMLSGYDVQLALGIFGDVCDQFPIQRPQFEMTAKAIVDYLASMVPERKGGDTEEDPHYGLFGAAYLTAAYTNRIGLKGYHFTISDAPARERLSEHQLLRIFGDDVFDKVAENGHQLERECLPTTKEVVFDLQKRAHAFFLQVGRDNETHEFWTDKYGEDRVVLLPETKYLPHVQAAIIGLTEGTLQLGAVEEFLTRNNVPESAAALITRSVSNIPIGAQAVLRSKLGHDIPKEGDIYNAKTDLLPVDSVDGGTEAPEKEGIDWQL